MFGGCACSVPAAILQARLPAELPTPCGTAPPPLRRSLPQTLADAKARGWLVLGAAAEPGAVPAAAFTLQRPAVLVMGNEGYGLRATIKRLCDAMLQVGRWGLGEGGVQGRPAGVLGSLA